MKKTSRLPRRAWAVLEADGQLAAHDGRLPLFWFRPVAQFFAAGHVVEPWRIVRVQVTLAPRLKRSRRRAADDRST